MVSKQSVSKALNKKAPRFSIKKFITGSEEFLRDVKNRIRSAQVKAAFSVNRELISLYWEIGKAIMERQEREGWGKGVVEILSEDLRREFPEMKGFSARNLWNMRGFYEAYRNYPILQQLVAEIPWGHNLILLNSVKDHRLRCLVAIDLKLEDFQPEFLGKMNFYLSALDDMMRHPDDQPSVGIILCKGKSKTIAEYALRDIRKPMGVSEYRFTRTLPKNLVKELPAPSDLQRLIEEE
jgi:predicted nuclease of restriction endonuclease-like (RecB) superfamily